MELVAARLAFVTGAGSGIGRETCRILAREGVKVVATDKNIKTAEETVSSLTGSGHIAIEVDVTSMGSIESAFKSTIKQFSRPPNIIVNSAGITQDNFLVKLTPAEFTKVLDVNLTGTFFVVQSAIKALTEYGNSEGSSIINLSSIIGKRGNIGSASYSAAKAGVIALTKTAAMECGKLGIRVNAVMPGFIDTPMVETIPDKVKDMFIKQLPLARMGKPEEVAEVIAFLASSKSSYINATTIEVTGGMS